MLVPVCSAVNSSSNQGSSEPLKGKTKQTNTRITAAVHNKGFYSPETTLKQINKSIAKIPIYLESL